MNYNYNNDFDDMEEFELWWENEVLPYANELNLSPVYVEEEFIIDGDLIKVQLRNASKTQK